MSQAQQSSTGNASECAAVIVFMYWADQIGRQPFLLNEGALTVDLCRMGVTIWLRVQCSPFMRIRWRS